MVISNEIYFRYKIDNKNHKSPGTCVIAQSLFKIIQNKWKPQHLTCHHDFWRSEKKPLTSFKPFGIFSRMFLFKFMMHWGYVQHCSALRFKMNSFFSSLKHCNIFSFSHIGLYIGAVTPCYCDSCYRAYLKCDSYTAEQPETDLDIHLSDWHLAPSLLGRSHTSIHGCKIACHVQELPCSTSLNGTITLLKCNFSKPASLH